MVKVTVRLIGTRLEALVDLDPDLTISECKTVLAAQLGISDAGMRLIYKGRVITGSATVSSLQLSPNDMIIAHTAKSQGAQHESEKPRPPAAAAPPPPPARPSPTDEEIIRAAQDAMDETVLLARFAHDQVAEIRRLHQRAGSSLKEVVQVFVRANENPQIAARMLRV
jgi:predicted Zn-dependent protease